MFRKLLKKLLSPLIERPLPRALREHLAISPECWMFDVGIPHYMTRLRHSTGRFSVTLLPRRIRHDDVIVRDNEGTRVIDLSRIERWLLAGAMRSWIKNFEKTI